MRTLNFARFFRKCGDIDIVYSEGAPSHSTINHLFASRYHFEKKPYPRAFLGRIRLAIKRVPYPIHEYQEGALRRLLELIEANDYRFIIVRYCHSTNGLFNLPERLRRRIIVDIDDVLSGSVYSSFFNANEGLHRRLMRELNRKLLARYETKCLEFGAALFCSDSDKEKFDLSGRTNIFVVPNIYENSLFDGHDFGDGRKHSNSLLFVGNLHYAPNIEGLAWFIQTVFRPFKALFNDTKLIVVGHAPSASVKSLCETEEGVALHPDVPDVRKYYEECMAVVVPLLRGGGTRIKILEAVLAGRPVLSTPVGAEGLDLKDGSDLLLFEGPEDFCAKYRELADQETYRGIVEQARRVLHEKYTRNNFEESMRQVLSYLGGAA